LCQKKKEKKKGELCLEGRNMESEAGASMGINVAGDGDLDGFDGGFVDSAEMAVDPGELEAARWGALHCREGEEVEPENNSQQGTSYPTLGP
jgi:hypothetical protein